MEILIKFVEGVMKLLITRYPGTVILATNTNATSDGVVQAGGADFGPSWEGYERQTLPKRNANSGRDCRLIRHVFLVLKVIPLGWRDANGSHDNVREVTLVVVVVVGSL